MTQLLLPFVDVNGVTQTVTIAAGATTNTVVVTVADSDDVFTEADQVTRSGNCLYRD